MTHSEGLKVLLSDDQLTIISEQLEELFTQGFNEVQAKRDMLNRYMNKKQTCLYLQISNNTLDKWIREEKLPVIRLNGSLRFDRIEIDKWLHQVAKIS